MNTVYKIKDVATGKYLSAGANPWTTYEGLLEDEGKVYLNKKDALQVVLYMTGEQKDAPVLSIEEFKLESTGEIDLKIELFKYKEKKKRYHIQYDESQFVETFKAVYGQNLI